MIWPFTESSIRAILLIKAPFRTVQAHMAVPGTHPCQTPISPLFIKCLKRLFQVTQSDSLYEVYPSPAVMPTTSTAVR